MKKSKVVLLPVLILPLFLIGCVEDKKVEVDNVSHEDTVIDSEYIVTIEGNGFTEEDMDFYTLMQKVKNEVNREKDAENLSSEELEENNEFWDTQNQQYDNVNVQLQNMIEIHAMSLLAKEKNYFVPAEKLDKEVADFNAAIATNSTIQDMIQQYGEKNYKVSIRGYTEERMLRDRVAGDIEKTVREENTDVSEQEIKFLINTQYDDLYEDHVSQLELVINLK